jgi:hypothetical protein
MLWSQGMPLFVTYWETTMIRKTVLATALATAAAVPGLASAQAAAPTLEKVLEASGLSLSGYIDAGYTHANRNVETGGFSTRVFDSQNNSFALHQVGVQIAKQPKEGFGGVVNVTAGSHALVIHSFDTTSESQFDVTQAFGQYASGSMTLMAGKFVTLQGTEVIWSPANPNFSRSILFGAIPFTHTGVRSVWAFSDKFSFTAGLNNGWDQVKDSNSGKTLELGTTLTPIKPLTIAASYYTGKETVPQATPGNPEGKRTSLNAVATYTVSDPLTLGAEILSVSQENFVSLVTGSPIKAKYSGQAFYVTYMIAPKWRAAGRLESFKDDDGFRFGTAGTKYKEFTATGAYLPNASFELRAELRRDNADNAVFVETGGAASKTLMTYALQALYKF